MAIVVLLGGVCHPGRVEIDYRHLADFGFWVEAPVDRSGSHNLTRENLDRFLARLDPDRQRAGEQYQKLYRQLVKLFEWRGAPCPESLADETIDRIIHKFNQLEIHDVGLYALGVARNVLKESQREAAKNARLDEVPARVLLTTSRQDAQQRLEKVDLAKRLECLDKCIRTLTAAERKLVLEYYEEKKSENIRQRQKMAEQLGIALGTLRVQAHRIRAKLAACVDRRLAERE